MKTQICFDECERDDIEKRLDIIYSLKRKYGNSIEEISKYKENVEKQIYEIENAEEYNKILRTRIKELEEEMSKCAESMEK